MLEQLSTYFNIDVIYLWLNFGVLPFWIILIFFPDSKICSFFVTSIFPYIIFSSIYVYLIYNFYLSEFNFLNNFNLYLGIEELMILFTDKSFILFFWIHFLAINLFCGSWIVKDGQINQVSKKIIFLPLLVTYFIGPLGVFIYWFIKIIYAKKISLFN